MRRTDLPHVTLDGRHTGQLIAHPCPCGHPACTLGEHLWQSTADMTPGPQAQTFEPPTSRPTTHTHTDTDPPPDPTTNLHTEYRQLLTRYHHASRDLTRFIDRYRPDRYIPLPEPATDDQWCRNHLETIGQCEPRYRGDLCRWCYDLGLAHNAVPDAELMRTRHHRGYCTELDIRAWRDRLPKAKTKKTKSRMANYG